MRVAILVASRAALRETSRADWAMPTMRVDCDIHPGLEGTRTTLLPYLDEHWQEQVISRGIDGLDLMSYPPSMPLCCRPDWRPKDGKPGSNFELLKAQALDAFGTSHAICNVLYGARSVFDPSMAAAFCRAINDRSATECLAPEPRPRASIVVPMQAPDLPVDEIRRLAGDHRFVAVLVLVQDQFLLGRRHFSPLYA